MVLDSAGDHPVDRAEALMIAAARAQHVAKVVRPALAEGRHVVTDRYLESSIAYQGHGRGLGPDQVAAVSAFATEGLVADLVVLIDVDGPVATNRRSSHLDRIELAGDEFHIRVVAAYRAMAKAEPDRWVVVDGVGTIEEVAERVATAVADRLGPA
jgi:dTMP kinase